MDTKLIDSSHPSFHSGFVALVGRPNAGKSTLINACLGTRVAITSAVPQTTRKRLRAIIHRPEAQLILVDTPGLHKPHDRLGEALNHQALTELDEVDVVAWVVDATKLIGKGDEWVASHVAASSAAKLLVLTKADIASKEQIERQISLASPLVSLDDTVVVSAKEHFNVEGFLEAAARFLPPGPKWFSDATTSDATDEELIAEFVREKVLWACKEEIPHAVGVTCDEIRSASKGRTYVACTLYVERESQKAIVIGKGGSMIKTIGSRARPDIETLLGTPVYLDLKVRVRKGWRESDRWVRAFGYGEEA